MSILLSYSKCVENCEWWIVCIGLKEVVSSSITAIGIENDVLICSGVCVCGIKCCVSQGMNDLLSVVCLRVIWSPVLLRMFCVLMWDDPPSAIYVNVVLTGGCPGKTVMLRYPEIEE